jgi:hypothetical protein
VADRRRGAIPPHDDARRPPHVGGYDKRGTAGWVTDSTGYRYTAQDPQTNHSWPAMAHVFSDLAVRAAAQAGFGDFVADACLINRYVPGARFLLAIACTARPKRERPASLDESDRVR